ncbi:hypothetical protein K503DRAFT_30011 [Rhizopogon vinicolor AM-OR11-026]|uniref:Uncharacterized protein n=1 Tax=Rhizopogon vinicolor AM-OR11-026 TaxID=1314800 RepID=A0A1B7N5C8_9AGAM|nr:hypothetical protein K503DRAFT_30011 [Rhizopogon vinicolor AM-OR11-026]
MSSRGGGGGEGEDEVGDRNHQDTRRFDDRAPERPHRPPYSPRRDSRERRSRTRSPRHSPSPRRHSRPHSPEGSTYRPSSRGLAMHESDHSPKPPSIPRSHYSEHRRTPSRSPRRSRQRSLSRDIKAEFRQDEKLLLTSPAHSLRSLHAPDEQIALPTSPRAKAEPDDDQLHVRVKIEPLPDSGHLGRSPTSSSRFKEESADRDAEGDFKMRDRSPVQQLHIPTHSPNHAVSALAKTPSTPISPAQSLKQTAPEEPPAEIPKPPTVPYLPPFPKLPSIKERLGSKYREELSQIEAMEAIRARTAAEYVQISKAVRRALHELDLTTMDLRAAQNRREHAENHRKKAAAGFLDIDAEFSAAA